MKRLLLISVVIFVLVFILISLFKPLSTPMEETIVEPADKEEVYELHFGHNIPLDSALHHASVNFANLVEKKSNGKVKIVIHPAQKLGNDHKMVELARKGEIDIILTPTAKMSVAVPAFQYADLPFFFPARQDVYDMLDGEPGKILLNKLKKIGLVGVTFWGNGFKHFTANSPILSPDDFQSKNIRVMKSRMIMDQFESFGANPIPIDFHSTRKALKDGVVDGQENPLVAIVTMGFHEVQSDLTLSEHAYLGYVFSISEKTFEKLPQDIRAILTESAMEITPIEREETDKKEKEFLEIIKKSGVNIHTLSEESRQKFAKLTKHIPKQFEEIIGSDIISKTEELLLEKYGPPADSMEQIVIGLNTDLSTDAKVAGLAIKRGIELAIKDINEQGGVLGKKLVLLAKDHRAISSKGVDNVKSLMKRKDIAAIVCGLHSAVVIEDLKAAKDAQIPFLIPWAAASEITESYNDSNSVFRISATDKLVSVFILKYALKKYSKPAIIVENSVWGRGNLEKMRSYLNGIGKSFTKEITYNRGQKVFDDELNKIIASGADSLIMISNPIEGGAIVRNMASNKNKIPIVSHWGIVGGPFFKENKNAIKKVDLTFFQTFSFGKNKNPKSSAMAKLYLKEYDKNSVKNIEAPVGVAQAHDLVQMLAMAIKKAGSTEYSKVREALENLEYYDGVVKTYKNPFSKTNHDALGVEDYYMAVFSPEGFIIPAEENE